MGTINRQIAADVIAGKYESDGIVKLVTYNNMFNGALEFATVHRGEDLNRYEKSPACHNVKTIWTRQQGLLLNGVALSELQLPAVVA